MTHNVNHPQHYENHRIVLEPIDIIEGLPVSIANVIQYIIRARDKGCMLEDYRKAKWYYNRVNKSFSHARLNELLAPLAVLRFSEHETPRDFARQIFNGREPWMAWTLIGGDLSSAIYGLLAENDMIPEELKEE